MLSRVTKQQSDYDKFPLQQLFILALIRVSEPIALTSIFPYAWKLVLHFNVGDRSHASFYAGILISAFSLAEALSGMFWGAYSDRVGRKPVLLLGCAGTVLSLLIVGLSQNIWLALFGRALGGFLNGNIGVIQTMVGELTVNPKHEPKAYAIMPFVWSIGTIIGPSIGGYFAAPSEQYPDLFPATGIFGRFPYLLPNLICAGLMLGSILAGWFLLEETHPDMRSGTGCANMANAEVETPLIPAQAGITNPPTTVVQDCSYGTFNNVQIDHDEDWSVEAGSRQESSNLIAETKVFNKRVIMLIVALGIFTYHSMTYDHLLPIFFQDERVGHMLSTRGAAFGGGLGLDLHNVGAIMSINGLIALFVQAVIFPILASSLGIWRLFITVTVLHPFSYVIVPYLAFLPPHLLYPGIYACLAIRNILSIMAFPTLLILIKEAAPSHSCLGKINGLAASTGAACRTVASPVSGYLYGVGVQLDYTAIAWFASAIVALVGVGQAFCIDQKRNDQDAQGDSRAHCNLSPTQKPKMIVRIRVREVDEEASEASQERTRLVVV